MLWEGVSLRGLAAELVLERGCLEQAITQFLLRVVWLQDLRRVTLS